MKHKISQKDLLSKVSLYIMKNHLLKSAKEVVIALSGGPDSVCLLDVMCRLQIKYGYNISVCHYNHKIRGEDSDKDEMFVKKICSDRGLRLEIAKREEGEKINNEEDARKLRYAFFQKIYFKKGGGDVKIVLGHNSNDLAETFLMRVIRGSGLKGLSAILPQRDFFIRPLLLISRSEITQYLKDNNLKFRTDKSNYDNKYLRNDIRNKLMPSLKNYNENIIETISRSTEQLLMDYQYIERSVQKVFDKTVLKKNNSYIIPKEEWLKVDDALKPHLIYLCLSQIGGTKNITNKHINSIVNISNNNIGGKTLPLPHSLRFEFKSGKIYIYKKINSIKENDGKPKKK